MSRRYLDSSRLNELAPLLCQHLDAEHGVDLGALEAQVLLEFIADHIGGAIYNQALADAQAALASRMESLQAAIWELER